MPVRGCVSLVRAALLPALLLLAAASTAPAAADPTLPDTPPARRLAEILDLINAGEREKIKAYAVAHFTEGMLKPDADSIVDFLMGQYEGIGGYDLRRIVQSADEQITALVQGRRKTDRWVRFVVGTEPEAPHRVQGLFLFPASSALAEQEEGPVSASELPERLAAMVDRIAAAGDFSGSVCLMQEGEVLLDRAWGLADREADTPNRTDTPFGIASLGKMFTAVAVAQLVEQGSLRYEDPIGPLIPDWIAPSSRRITIEQLLTHRSGLGDYLEVTMADRSRQYDALEDYRPIAAKDTSVFTPGTDFRYSNTGYLLLGAVIQKISGEPWDRYLEARVFEPAGMAHTDAYRPRLGEGFVAIGYLRDAEGRWRRNDDILSGRGTPAGGSVSTARDLAGFGSALLDGRLISAEALAELATPHADMKGVGVKYGYGFTISRSEPGKRIFGHAGGFPGVSAVFEVDEATGSVLAVLSNQSEAASSVADAWRDLLRRSRSSSRP